MSAPNEVPVWGAGFGLEGGEQASLRLPGPGAPRAPRLGLDPGPPRSGEGEGGFPEVEGFESERQVLEAGGPVLWGREGRPGSPADDKGDAPECAPQLADETAADVVLQLTARDVLGEQRNPSPEGGTAEASGGLADLEAGPGEQGTLLALGRVESQPPSAAATLLHVAVPKGRRAGATPRRGAKSRAKAKVDRQRPSATEGPGARLSSDPESSNEVGEIQLMRVRIYAKEGGQAKPSSPEDPGDTPRHSSVHIRGFLHVPSAPWGSTSVGELDMSSFKKMPSVVWGKGESRPSYRGAAAAAAAAAPPAAAPAAAPAPAPAAAPAAAAPAAAPAAAEGGLPGATCRRKATQKKSLEGPTKVTSGKSFPSWGQRVSAAPQEPATFPRISGVPLLGKSKRSSLGPPGTKQPKHTGAGKKSVARRTREAEVVAAAAVAGEDNDSSRDGVPKGQCLVLQREIDDLKEQLAAMRSLTDKFQAL